MKPKLKISEDSVLDLLNISFGIFSPLTGFMTGRDYRHVVRDYHTADGAVWPIPITLEIPESDYRAYTRAGTVELTDESGITYGEMRVNDVFRIDPLPDVKRIYGTTDQRHPGVHKELGRSRCRVGGSVTLTIPRRRIKYLDREFLLPREVKREIKRRGLKTVTGFQTRNPVHLAHEYLQRIALEVTDGLFIHPLIGWKKCDDFSPTAIKKAYRLMIDEFYPKDRVLFSVLQTAMRYAGPREAVFHALIRKNYGCTHFIVGRDHAGVGGYYGKYEAQQFIASIPDLGITILPLAGPFYCRDCQAIMTEKSCGHYHRSYTKSIIEISGTEIRNYIRGLRCPPRHMMRREIGQVLIELQRRGKVFAGG